MPLCLSVADTDLLRRAVAGVEFERQRTFELILSKSSNIVFFTDIAQNGEVIGRVSMRIRLKRFVLWWVRCRYGSQFENAAQS